MKSISLLLAYILFVALIFFGLPDEALYGQSLLSWTPFILMFVIQPILLHKVLVAFKVPPTPNVLLSVGSVLVIMPLFGIYLGYQQKLTLRQHGRETKGVVYRKWYSGGKTHAWLLRCSFSVNGKTYSTFSTEDKNDLYLFSDTLTILYNENFPQQCIIKELEREYLDD